MNEQDEMRERPRIADNQVLRALTGGPRLRFEEVRARLGLSPETFIDVWEGRSVLYGDAREALVQLLREEIEWHRSLLFRLERERAVEGATDQNEQERTQG